VSLASSDLDYKNLSKELRSKGEYQFLKKAVAKPKYIIQQGIYIVTPSGKLLKKLDWGWPLPVPSRMNVQLVDAIEKYKGMSKEERLGSILLTEDDRSMPVNSKKLAPASWLQLRNTSRSYAFPEMDQFDIRHPVFVTVDKLWFSDEEKLKFVPSNSKKGTREKVNREALNTLLLNSHLIIGRSAWWIEHIKQAEMEMEVISSESDEVLIHYTGEFKMKANSKWCQESYEGKLLGKAIWSPVKKDFTAFEWVSLGEHQIDNLKSNMHRGNTKKVSVAARLELDPLHKCEEGILPANWPYSYADAVVKELK
jgi:hypothetical protein